MASKSISQDNQHNVPEVICLGEALIDRLGPLGGDPAVDEPVMDCFGGAPANVACGLAQLGNKVAFVGRLGNDQIGEGFINLMAIRGVNLLGLQIDQLRPSRVVLVCRDANGERSFQGFAGDQGQGFADQALELTGVQTVSPLLFPKACWLLIGTIPLAKPASAEALLWMVQGAQKNGIEIALDVNWRPTFWDNNYSPDSGPDQVACGAISRLLPYVSLLKLAKEEAIWFFNSDDPLFISSSLQNRPDVVVTNGSCPLRWCIGDQVGEMKVLSPSKVIDTTGAGDAFMAGLLNQFLRYRTQQEQVANIQEMMSFAAACGALVCGRAGAIDSQPNQDEVEAFLNAINKQ